MNTMDKKPKSFVMKVFKMIGNIIKYAWKTIMCIKNIMSLFFLVIFFFIFFGTIGLVIELNNNEKAQKGVLVLDIQGKVVDNPAFSSDTYDLLTLLNDKNGSERENSVFTLARKIEQAEQDSNIKALVLKLDKMTSIDIPSASYLANKLNHFKKSGKRVVAFSSTYSAKHYYLASISDKICLQQIGEVDLYGLSVNTLFFKTLLDKLKVNMHVFKVGTYKSAVEPFTLDKMSAAAKSNMERWLNTLWEQFITDISSYRDIKKDQLVPQPKQILADLEKVNGNLTDYALKYGLVDYILSEFEFDSMVEETFKEKTISIYDYKLRTEIERMNKKIQIISVEGPITSSDSDNKDEAGSQNIIKQLNKAYKNNVSAIVLRVNSPGGSVVASEEIRQKLKFIKGHNIPIVVSMGGMAASGGYWISTESDYIFADKNTLTGSIGIFAMIPTFEQSIGLLGVSSETISTSPLAANSLTDNLSPEQTELYQLSVNNGYEQFVSIVSASRKIPLREVEKLAEGQVWLGSEAVKNHLVDELGSINDAIIKAAKLAKIDDYQIIWPAPNKQSRIIEWLLSVSVYLPETFASMIYQHIPLITEFKQRASIINEIKTKPGLYIYCLSCQSIN